MIESAMQTAGSGTAKPKRTRGTDGTAHLTPQQTANRWAWHQESVRRKIRRHELGAIVIGRRLLIPLSEIERVEREGRI